MSGKQGVSRRAPTFAFNSGPGAAAKQTSARRECYGRNVPKLELVAEHCHHPAVFAPAGSGRRPNRASLGSRPIDWQGRSPVGRSSTTRLARCAVPVPVLDGRLVTRGGDPDRLTILVVEDVPAGGMIARVRAAVAHDDRFDPRHLSRGISSELGRLAGFGDEHPPRSDTGPVKDRHGGFRDQGLPLLDGLFNEAELGPKPPLPL